MKENKTRKTNNILSVAITISVMIMITIILALFTGCTNNNKSVVTTNENDESVFTISVDEYLEEYGNKLEKYDIDFELTKNDFEFVQYEGETFFNLELGSMGMFTLYAEEDGSDFESIYFLIYEPQEDIPAGVLCLLRAIYPDDETEDMNKAYWEAEDNGSASYKDVLITCIEYNGVQDWSIKPND